MTAPKIIRMDGTPDPEEDRLAALEARVGALERDAEKARWVSAGGLPSHFDKTTRVKNKEPNPEDLLPTRPDSKAIADIFHRRHTTPWDPKEVVAMKKLRPPKGMLDLKELELLHRYEESERALVDKDGKRIGIHRRDLLTFLNNYRTECDRAREWARRNPRSAQRPLSNGSVPKTADVEPEGWQAWFDATYPTKAGTPFHQTPEDIRKQYRK